MEFAIEGIGIAPGNRAEYTSGAVLSEYLKNINILKDIFDSRAGTGGSFIPVTIQDFDKLILAMRHLRTLAQQGITEEVTPLANVPTDKVHQTFYLTAEMAIDLDLVFKSLKAAGIVIDAPYPDSLKVSLLQDWQSLAGFGVQNIMNNAAGVSSNYTRTLQSMIELEYVKQGNDLLAIKFKDLEESLRTTDAILKALTTIQGISNQINIENRGDFAFPPTNSYQIPSGAVAALQRSLNETAGTQVGTVYDNMRGFSTTYNNEVAQAQANALANRTTFSVELSKLTGASNVISTALTTYGVSYYTKLYKIAASVQFSQVFPTSAATSTAATELLDAKQRLMTQLVALEGLKPADETTVNDRTVEGSLASFIYKVAIDISNAFKNIDLGVLTPAQIKTAYSAAVATWILDNQNQKAGSVAANSAGSIQDRITQAIKAAESLNDTEKEKVRDYQFVFEQFYKSASGALQKVSQIIEKVAQGIGR